VHQAAGDRAAASSGPQDAGGSTSKPAPAARPRKSTTASAHPRRRRPKLPAAKPSQRTRGDVAGDQDHGELAIGELAIATAAIVAQVIAAAGAEATYPTGRQRREKLR
jgi:hypothetical protein